MCEMMKQCKPEKEIKIDDLPPPRSIDTPSRRRSRRELMSSLSSKSAVRSTIKKKNIVGRRSCTSEDLVKIERDGLWVSMIAVTKDCADDNRPANQPTTTNHQPNNRPAREEIEYCKGLRIVCQYRVKNLVRAGNSIMSIVHVLIVIIERAKKRDTTFAAKKHWLPMAGESRVVQ